MENTQIVETIEESRTIQDFLTKYPVTLTLIDVPENPQMDNSASMLNYHATLGFEGRVMSLYFSTGVGWVEQRKRLAATSETAGATTQWINASMVSYDKRNKRFLNARGQDADGNFNTFRSQFRIKKPTAADILDCLASDASGADQQFDDWASDLGYDTDSRKAFDTYQTIQRQIKELRQLLGREAYNELLSETERM